MQDTNYVLSYFVPLSHKTNISWAVNILRIWLVLFLNILITQNIVYNHTEAWDKPEHNSFPTHRPVHLIAENMSPYKRHLYTKNLLIIFNASHTWRDKPSSTHGFNHWIIPGKWSPDDISIVQAGQMTDAGWEKM